MLGIEYPVVLIITVVLLSFNFLHVFRRASD